MAKVFVSRAVVGGPQLWNRQARSVEKDQEMVKIVRTKGWEGVLTAIMESQGS